MNVMQVTTHPAELCPTHESKYRDLTINWYEKIEGIAAKFGVKFVGSYDDHPAHTVYVLYDTPSMDNFMAMMMDPEASAPMNFCCGRVFPVFNHQQTLAMLKR
jgi:hypothetical protein